MCCIVRIVFFILLLYCSTYYFVNLCCCRSGIVPKLVMFLGRDEKFVVNHIICNVDIEVYYLILHVHQ